MNLETRDVQEILPLQEENNSAVVAETITTNSAGEYKSSEIEVSRGRENLPNLAIASRKVPLPRGLTIHNKEGRDWSFGIFSRHKRRRPSNFAVEKPTNTEGPAAELPPGDRPEPCDEAIGSTVSTEAEGNNTALMNISRHDIKHNHGIIGSTISVEDNGNNASAANLSGDNIEPGVETIDSTVAIETEVSNTTSENSPIVEVEFSDNIIDSTALIEGEDNATAAANSLRVQIEPGDNAINYTIPAEDEHNKDDIDFMAPIEAEGSAITAAKPPSVQTELGSNNVTNSTIPTKDNRNDKYGGECDENDSNTYDRTATLIETFHRDLLPSSLKSHCGEGSYWAVDPYSQRRTRKREFLTVVESPKKVRKKSTKTNTTEGTSTGKRKRGRPRKRPTEEENSSSTSTNGTSPVKRKRGRPRKKPLEEGSSKLLVKVPDESSKQSSVVTNDANPVKRKRGRPRKIDIPHKKSTNAKSVTPKIKSADATPTNGKRKRGRPRKSETVPPQGDDKTKMPVELAKPTKGSEDSTRTTKKADKEIDFDIDEIIRRNSPMSDTTKKKVFTVSIERMVAQNKVAETTDNHCQQLWHQQTEKGYPVRDDTIEPRPTFAPSMQGESCNLKIDLFMDAIRSATELMVSEPIFERNDGDGVVIFV